MALLLGTLVTGAVVGASPAAAAARPFSVRFSQNIEGGQIRVAGNSWLTCSTTTGTAATTCAAAKSYGASGIANSNNPTSTGSRTMVANDVDGDATTGASSSSTLDLPADAVVVFAGLYWWDAGAIGNVRLDTPATAGIAYQTVPSTQNDSVSTSFSGFADVTAAVAAGGSGSYTVAPTFTPTAASGWSMMVVYGQPGGTNRQVVINDGLVLNNANQQTAITFGGFKTPPSGNVNADVATIIYDPDAGYTDSVTLGPTAASQTKLANPGPIANDYANASVRNFNVKPTGAPDDANNFSIDAKVTSTSNLIGNNQTTAVAAFDTRGSSEVELPAVIGIAIDNYAAGATLTKNYVDENGGAVEPGDLLTYNLSVQSTGSEAIQLSTLTDPLPAGVDYVPGSIRLGAGNYTSGAVTDTTGDDVGEYDAPSRTVRVRLGQGASAVNGGTLPPRPNSPTQTATFRVRVPTSAAAQAVSNRASLSGTGAQTGQAVSIDSPSSTFTPSLAPALTIDKTATLNDGNDNGAADFGESISYGFTVKNTGNVQLTGVQVTDPTLGTVSCQTAVLEPQATTTCSGPTRQVSQADVDSGVALTNTATATGTVPGGSQVTGSDSTSTPVAAGAPVLQLTKIADWTDTNDNSAIDVGETIRYSFLLTNTGTVSATNPTITDPLLTAAGLTLTCPTSPLGPNAQETCTTSGPYVVTQDDVDAGELTNTATASATNPRGGTVTSNPSSTTTPAVSAPAIRLDKTATVSPATDSGAAKVGDTIGYTFTATNTGNVTLSAVGVTDPSLGAVVCDDVLLRPGQHTDCRATATRTVTQADADRGGSLDNTATASGTPPQGDAITGTDTASVPLAATTPALSVVVNSTLNDGNGNGVIDPGETVSYTYTVTNTGTATVSGVGIDNSSGLGGTITCSPTTLAPNQTATCTRTADYAVTQADLNSASIANSATAHGTAPGAAAATTSPAGSATVTTNAPRSLTLTKSVDPATVPGAGKTVTYTFAVKNTGSASITGIRIDDTAFGGSGTLGPITCQDTVLDAGATTTCTATYTTTAADVTTRSVGNAATAHGTSPTGVDIASPASTATLTVAAPPTLSSDTAHTPFGTPVPVPVLGDDRADPATALDPSSVVFPVIGQPAGSTVSPDGKTLTVTGQGVYVVGADGRVTFTPADGFTGTATPVTYQAADNLGATATASLTITVGTAPKATDDRAATASGTPVTVPVLANDTADPTTSFDPSSVVFPAGGQPAGATVSADGKTLTVPAQGVYTINPDGSISFAPAPGFSGDATPVTYRAADGDGNTATATVSVTVGTPPNGTPDVADAPYGKPVTINVLGNDVPGTGAQLVPASLALSTAGLLAGSTLSPDGKVVTIPGVGVFRANNDGTVTFTPAAGFRGRTPDVTYTIADSDGVSTSSTVAVVVAAPPATGGTGSTGSGGSGGTGSGSSSGGGSGSTGGSGSGGSGAGSDSNAASTGSTADTGVPSAALITLGLSLLVAGAALIIVTRRRRTGRL